MPQRKQQAEVKNEQTEVDPEVIYYMNLVYTIRNGKPNSPEVNQAFSKVVDGLETKIKKIAGKFKIPGFTFDDIFQESLFALRFKAIKDYDETRGSVVGSPAPFDRFALLCIRRHLATTLKTSHQNKKRILNTCKSLDQDRSNDNDDLSLVNILPQTNGDVLESLQSKEYFHTLVRKLLGKLSALEKQVFFLYAQQYTYEEIAQLINDRSGRVRDKAVDYKGVDNALSRIKHKAHVIFERFLANEEDRRLLSKVMPRIYKPRK
jgi:RNA polymerase sporulation-specific sigma factor